MDLEDRLRTRQALYRLRELLRLRHVLTNHEVRAVAGSRGMARVHELIHDFDEPITVVKDRGATWLVTYEPKRAGQSTLF